MQTPDIGPLEKPDPKYLEKLDSRRNRIPYTRSQEKPDLKYETSVKQKAIRELAFHNKYINVCQKCVQISREGGTLSGGTLFLYFYWHVNHAKIRLVMLKVKFTDQVTG